MTSHIGRTALRFVVPLVAVVAIAGLALKQSDKKSLAEEAAAPAQAVPTLKGLLEETGYAFSQPKKGQPAFRVTVESDGSATVVAASERTAGWKYSDGSPVPYASMYTQATQWYKKDVEIPGDMLRKMAEMNDSTIFMSYSISVDNTSGSWAVFVNSYYFLKHGSPDILSDHIWLLSEGAKEARKALAPFVEE